ncbi:hypothetical protein TNIN_375831 [Trichonephila inaurata madagascariensis]|uniref:Uncharacterized protein n=1 Tax=Trichonephila inaurata madagascariensis TaxID=2747483 RepID=A0A8X6WWX1_9ARAC|nr:hypothetical protein TNIN_375831 [Trichonephila inaurata madagascariensis]
MSQVVLPQNQMNQVVLPQNQMRQAIHPLNQLVNIFKNITFEHLNDLCKMNYKEVYTCTFENKLFTAPDNLSISLHIFN